MPEQDDCSAEELIEGMDAVHVGICAGQRELFRFIAHADFTGAWWDSGARDLAHWLSMRYGISHWKANRWIAAAHALEGLPLISQAFSSGELSIDKVVELTRFATAETEADSLPGPRGCPARPSGTGETWPPAVRSRTLGRRQDPLPVMVVLR